VRASFIARKPMFENTTRVVDLIREREITIELKPLIHVKLATDPPRMEVELLRNRQPPSPVGTTPTDSWIRDGDGLELALLKRPSVVASFARPDGNIEIRVESVPPGAEVMLKSQVTPSSQQTILLGKTPVVKVVPRSQALASIIVYAHGSQLELAGKQALDTHLVDVSVRLKLVNGPTGEPPSKIPGVSETIDVDRPPVFRPSPPDAAIPSPVR